MSNDPKENIHENLGLSDEFDLGKTVENIFTRPITKEEYQYLLSIYPYITVCDKKNAYIGPQEVPVRKRTQNGWQMFIYESAICLGTNYLEVQHYQSENHIEGVGTLVKQGYDAIVEMIQYIQEQKKWETIEIVFGTYQLQRLVWAICDLLDHPVFGFMARQEDEVIKHWIKQMKGRRLYPTQQI